MTLRLLGEIARLQIQRVGLKADGVYDPAGLLAVERGSIDAQGMVGWSDGGWMLDVHHGAHPGVRGGGRRALSIGFTGHYALMADRFGGIADGAAGENLIVDHDGRIEPPDIAGGLVVRTPAGDVELRSPRVAAPCVEFTSYLLGAERALPRAEIAADLAALDGGMRGYIVAVDHLERPVELAVGAEIFAIV